MANLPYQKKQKNTQIMANLREYTGLSIKEFANICEDNVASIYAYESGYSNNLTKRRNNPTLKKFLILLKICDINAIKISDKLQIKIDDFLNELSVNVYSLDKKICNLKKHKRKIG